MTDLLKDIVTNSSPRFSKIVVDGSIKSTFKTFPEYLDATFKSSILSLSDKVKLEYLGYRKVSPMEEINNTIITNDANIIYDVAKNDVYLIELKFAYDGVIFKRYLYLPFAERGNIVNFSGTPYHIVPVLSDNIISPNYKEIFVRLLKAKLTFMSAVRNFVYNGVRTPGEVIHCQVLRVNKPQIVDNIGKPLVATSLYLVAERGFKDTLKHYCGVTDYVITNENVDNLRDDYNVFESTRMKPRGLKETVYLPHSIKICIRKGNYNTALVNSIVYGIIYTFDIFPETADEVMNVININDAKMEQMFWYIYIGRLSYKNTYSIDRMYGDTIEHFDSLKGYIDNDTRQKLSHFSRPIDTIFDLIAVILENYSTWIMTSKEYNSSVDNRYIDVKYYILYDIIIGFNRIMLNINKRVGKKSSLSLKEIQSLFKKELSPKLILGLTKSSSVNLAVMGCSYTGDIMYPKITSLLEDQSRGIGVKRGRKSQLPETAKTLKAGDLGFGSLMFLGKTLPSPRFKQNLYLNYDINTGKIKHSKQVIKMIEALDKPLSGREDLNSKIIDSEFISDDDIE